MKKLASALVMILLVCSLFAAENSVIRVKSYVSPTEPIFQIKAGLEEGNYTTSADRESGDAGSLASPKNIGIEDITMYCQIYQKSLVRSLRSYTIEIGATPMSAIAGGNTFKTGNPTISPIVGTPAADINGPVALTSGTNSLTATYTGGVLEQALGTFSVTWPSNNNIPALTYTGSVTITYTIE